MNTVLIPVDGVLWAFGKARPCKVWDDGRKTLAVKFTCPHGSVHETRKRRIKFLPTEMLRTGGWVYVCVAGETPDQVIDALINPRCIEVDCDAPEDEAPPTTVDRPFLVGNREVSYDKYYEYEYGPEPRSDKS